MSAHRYLAERLGRFASSLTGTHASGSSPKIDKPGNGRDHVHQIPRVHRTRINGNDLVVILSVGPDSHPAAVDAGRWTRILGRYREPSCARSIAELAITAMPLVALWVAAWLAVSLGYWWAPLLIAVPAAGFLVRLFLIQHDCGHGAYFAHRRANDWVGRVIGVLTLTPYDYWRRSHAIHHATSGNLDRRGIGDLTTLTVREYRACSRWGRLRYRLYRHPLVMFGVGPAYLFFLQHRLPVRLMRAGWQPWLSTMATNVAIAVIVAVLIRLIGVKAFLLVHLPMTLLAGSIGVWLFYVQHQFEDTTWSEGHRWSLHDAALHGSSHYDLPVVLRWFTANIGIHHVHHLCSRIPYYRLPQVLRDHPELGGIGRLTLRESVSCVRLVLWDETERRLVSFRDARTSR
jgi:acyl-lipid omega-6 desaturase (Delta-12 desaturase)